MLGWRHDFHLHPELGFKEHRTAENVATFLEEFGIQIHRGIGGTGVVGILQAGDGAAEYRTPGRHGCFTGY